MYFGMINMIFYYYYELALVISYTLTFIVLYLQLFPPGVVNALETVGQMTLTNYIMHSCFYLAIFYNVGLGWYQEISVLQGIGLAFLIFVFQIFINRYFYSRWKQGP